MTVRLGNLLFDNNEAFNSWLIWECWFDLQRHEADANLRKSCCLSFEGFARFLMDKDNYAYLYEKTKHNDEVRGHS